MSRSVALIPVRGGSKGLPGKNIRVFCGKPLLVHSIEAASEATGIDAVFVSTDDDAISSGAKKAGAETILRPKELATDNASIFSGAKHAAEVLEYPEISGILQPTSPLRRSRHIDEALAL